MFLTFFSSSLWIFQINWVLCFLKIKKIISFLFCFQDFEVGSSRSELYRNDGDRKLNFSNPKKLQISKTKHLRDSIWKRWYYLTHKMMWETNLKTLFVKTEEKQTCKKMERKAKASSEWKSHSNDLLFEWQLDIFKLIFLSFRISFFVNFELPQRQSCGF